MSSSYGNRLSLTIFGQSHSPAIGMTLEGLPAVMNVDMEARQSKKEYIVKVGNNPKFEKGETITVSPM